VSGLLLLLQVPGTSPSPTRPTSSNEPRRADRARACARSAPSARTALPRANPLHDDQLRRKRTGKRGRLCSVCFAGGSCTPPESRFRAVALPVWARLRFLEASV